MTAISSAPSFVLATRARRARRRSAMRWGAVYLMVLGATLLGYVGYELWGTSIGTARAQTRLKVELRTRGFPERPIPGGAIGYIRIPRIDLDMAFVQGTSIADLAKGPGHYPGTPLPGQTGNVVIAGHRTTHLAPFWSLDALRPGDRIELQTRHGTFVYDVRWAKVLPRDAWWVAGAGKGYFLTLTTCNPRFSNRQRLVVRAVQVSGPSEGLVLGVDLHPRFGDGVHR